MNITEDKLKAGIQIALGTLGLYTEEAETLLIHHIKALTIPVVCHPLFCETCKTNVSYWPDLDRHTCNCGRTIKAK